MGHYDEEIKASEKEINRLHKNIHRTFKERHVNKHKLREWRKACEIFHARYSGLAFPGGWAGALTRIEESDQKTIEAALCFVEIRPYFFRSGYMFKDILRKLRRAELSGENLKRYNEVYTKYKNYRQARIKKEINC